MKRQFAAVCVLFLAASVSHAGVISLVDCSMDTLLGSGYSAVGSAAVADMKSDGITYGEVTNQAYVNSAGDLWAYLYQVENTGETNILMFTLWPFGGADDNTQMGWLNDTNWSGRGLYDWRTNRPTRMALFPAAQVARLSRSNILIL